MTRTAAVLLSISLFAAVTATAHGSTGGREEVETYSAPHGWAAGPTYGAWSIGIRYLGFTPRAGERSVQFKVEDALDGAVGARAYVDLDGDGSTDATHYFCGASRKVRVRPGTEVHVGLVAGQCPDGSTATVPTQGTVTATFSP